MKKEASVESSDKLNMPKEKRSTKKRIAGYAAPSLLILLAWFGANPNPENWNLEGIGIHTIEEASFFENAKEDGIICSKNWMETDDLKIINSIPLIAEEIDSQDTINILMPFQISDPNVKMQYERELNEINKINFKNVPSDSIIVSPIDGQLLFTAISYAGREEVAIATIYFQDSNGAKHSLVLGENVVVNNCHASPTGFSFKPLVDATPYEYQSNLDIATLCVPVKRGQPIMMNTQKGDISLTSNMKLNLITLPDSATQQQKAVVIRKPSA